MKGPKLYNLIVNHVNKLRLASLNRESHIENLFLKPFKNMINSYLANIQKTGSHEWNKDNSALEILSSKDQNVNM